VKPGSEGSQRPADFGGGQPPPAASAAMNALAPIPIVGDLVTAGKNIHEMATGGGK
jgi:hypothetical protein